MYVSTRRVSVLSVLLRLAMLSAFASVIAIGCSSDVRVSDQARNIEVAASEAPSESSRGLIITLGDIEPEEPVKKVKRFQPLADYLAENLKEFGIGAGNVAIARDIEEMGRFMKEGTVDVYFDSSFPTLSVQELSGSEVILRRWKKGEHSYWSTFVALSGNGISSVNDFAGKVLAFEESHSTSGFVLPAGTLIQRGFTLREVVSPETPVAADVVGYVFTQDEKSTFEYLSQGVVAGGGVSNKDYEKLPEELKRTIMSLDRTVTVPRQLVSVRPGLNAALVARISELLIGLEDTDEGRVILKGLKSTKRFDALPPNASVALAELTELMHLVAQN